MTQDEPWTIGRLLQWTEQYLKQRGAASARLDAEVLLAFARDCPRIELYTAFDELAAEDVRQTFRQLVRRRAEGTPVAYLVGTKEFYSLPFQVTPDVLIPRPETEFLVVRLLDLAKQAALTNTTTDPATIIDVGTGSGILAICAALHLPTSQITAADVSAPALAVATANARRHGVTDRIRFIESDLFGRVPAEDQFDFIISNPPYVSTQEFAELAPEVRHHEPRLALVAGEQGTEVISRLIAQSTERLNPGGWLLIEVSPMIVGAVRDQLVSHSRFDSVGTVKDLAGLPRVVEARGK